MTHRNLQYSSRDKMDYLGLSEATYWDFFEENLNVLVQNINPEAFLTKLRSMRYMSEPDAEEIMSPFIHPTRRDRARKFCDVLMTKGFDAFKMFMELLEYEYPHVYTRMTNTPASSPPEGYERHSEGRVSQNLEKWMRGGFKIQNLQNQQRDLYNEIEALQSMLEFSQKEKNDLEREIQSLRPLAIKNQQMREKVTEAEQEIRNLKDENRDFMKKNIMFRDDLDRSNSRIEQLLIDRDDLETKLKECTSELDRMNQSQDVLIEKFEEERKKSQRLINLTARIRTPQNPRQPPQNPSAVSTKLEILQCDLDAKQEKVNDLCETLKVTQSELDSERQAVETMRRENLKLKRETDNTALFLKHAERKNDQYFKTIQELEKEKRKAEEEMILAQQKYWEIRDQKQRLFEDKHFLEQKYDLLRQKFEKLRESHCTCSSDMENIQDGGEKANIKPHRNQRAQPISSPTPSPRDQRDPFQDFAPYPPANHFRYQSEASSEEFDANHEAGVFTLSLDLIPTDSPYSGWFDGEEAVFIDSPMGVPRDGDEIVEKINMKNLFVRSNLTWEDRGKEDSVPIQDGEFLFISEVVDPHHYKVNKVEPTSGHKMRGPASGLVPDYELAKQQYRRPSQGNLTPEPCPSRTNPIMRRVAIRNREFNPYTVIAPLKANQKLPVLLSGSHKVVEAILDILTLTAVDWAVVERNPDMSNQRQNWRAMCNLVQHTILPAYGFNYQSDRDQHRYIVINVRIMGDNSQDKLKSIFGHDFDNVGSDRDSVTKWTPHTENIVLPSAKITDRESLVSQVHEKIQKVQDSIFWRTISWKTINTLRTTC